MDILWLTEKREYSTRRCDGSSLYEQYGLMRSWDPKDEYFYLYRFSWIEGFMFWRPAKWEDIWWSAWKIKVPRGG